MMQRQQYPQPQPPFNVFYPPQQSPYPPPYDQRNKRDTYYDSKYFNKPQKRGKNRARRMLKKYFFVVAFPFFLRK